MSNTRTVIKWGGPAGVARALHIKVFYLFFLLFVKQKKNE